MKRCVVTHENDGGGGQIGVHEVSAPCDSEYMPRCARRTLDTANMIRDVNKSQ
jgi:hypothetical protein